MEDLRVMKTDGFEPNESSEWFDKNVEKLQGFLRERNVKESWIQDIRKCRKRYFIGFVFKEHV